MITIHNKHLDLEKIAHSGQCFLWERREDGVWKIPAFGKELLARQEGDAIVFHCSHEDFHSLWHTYFDLEQDYAQYHNCAENAGFAYLKDASEFSVGIRILKQEKWETLVSFIISQNNNIPRITTCLKRIIKRFGGFPLPRNLTAGSLAGLGLGYREEYLYDAARRYSPEMEDFSEILGVGPKVNSCVRLFALAKKDEFPRDVWIKRIEGEHFGGRFPVEKFPGFAGVMQQFLFYFGRRYSRLT
ncbi:MAG: 8-oxoguanine DNA glycosylase [Oscillospiraceae bacterium]|nr:8-oxoguanine DNA glycosylase [Oscillospiraceae bacterium]